MALDLFVQDDNNFILDVPENDSELHVGQPVVKQMVNDYEDLTNKPSINDVELIGNKTTEDLHLDLVHTDTTANWNAQRDFVAEKGHIYVYSDYQTIDGVPVPGLKVGDGSSYLIDMPFVGASDRALLEEHIRDNVRHITAEERQFWNNKVTCFISSGDSETIVFTKNNI